MRPYPGFDYPAHGRVFTFVPMTEIKRHSDVRVAVIHYCLVTGQSHDSMMVTVTHMIRISLIVVAAKTVSVAGSDFYRFLNTTLPQEINYVVTGDFDSPKSQIDRNLLKVSAATSVIDMVKVPTGDAALAAEKAHTSMMATFGIAAPAMTAAAMLLLYQIALAMLTGLAPLFIMCLMFDQTKELFRRWLMYLLGTMFSMAMLNLVIGWTLDLTWRVADALWATDALARMTGLTAQGFSTQAFQQGGVGLLMTALIISTPPMAAMLFNGTLGSFSPYATINGGGSSGRPGPQGQPPGSYGGGNGRDQLHPANQRANQDQANPAGFPSPAPLPQRGVPLAINSANRDETKPFVEGTRT